MELLPEPAAHGKAVLAVTHDDRYFHLADRCIKLENGRVVSGAVHSAEMSIAPPMVA